MINDSAGTSQFRVAGGLAINLGDLPVDILSIWKVCI